MPLTRPQAGHGALIAIELDPVAQPGVFTTIAKLNGDINWPSLSRPSDETTGHDENIDSYVVGSLTRAELTWGMAYLYDNATHDFETGLGAKIVANEFFGIRVRGPQSVSDADEWIMSGQMTELTQTAPVRSGARAADATFRPSGLMKVNGAIIGA